MRAIHLLGPPCAARRRRRRHPRAPRPPTLRRRPRSRSAFRIWFGWTAFPRSRPPRTASGSPIRCAPPTSRRTRGVRPSGFSMSADEMRRRCVSRIWPRTRPRPSGAPTGASCITCPIEAARCRYGARRRAASPCKSPICRSTSATFRVAPKSDRVLVSLEVYPDCASLDCTKQRLDAAAHRAAHGVLYDKIFVRHWDAWSDGRRSQLFAIALDEAGLANGTPVNLTAGIDGDVPSKPFGGREDYAISPDGRQVAFSVRAVPVGEPWSTNFDVYTVASAGGTARNWTADNPAWDSQPAYSPDGSTLAYLATDRPGFEADRFHLVLLNLKTGGKRPLTQPGTARSAASPGRMTARRCSPPPIIWASVRCGRSTRRPAGRPPSPEPATSRASASVRRKYSTRSAIWRTPPICTPWDSPAASRSSSRI